MFRRRMLVAAIALASLATSATPALADEAAQKALERLDGDSFMVFMVRPRGPKAVLDWLGKFGGATRTFIQEGLDEMFRDVRGATGIDPGNPATWGESGLDLDAPVSAGFGVDVAAAEKAFTALTTGKRDPKKDGKVARPWFRVRIVAKVTDEKKLKALVEKMAGVSAGKLALVGKTDARGVAAAMAIDEKQGGAASKALAKAKVLVSGRYEEMFLFVRLDGGYAVVDLVMPFASKAVPFDWKRDGAKMLKVVGRSASKGGMSSVLTRGAGQTLADADLAFWTEPSRGLDGSKATGWHNIVEAVSDTPEDQRAPLITQGAAEVQACEQFRPLAQTGAFEDVAITWNAPAGAFEWKITYGMRKAYAFAATLVSANDGLVDLGATSDAVAIGALYLNGLGPVRAMPRPGVMGKPMNEITDAMFKCGWGGTTSAVLFGWPQFLGAALDDEAQRDAEFKSIVDNVRNMAFALRNVAASVEAMTGVVVASFNDTPDLDWIVKQLNTKPQTFTISKRAVTYYPGKSRWEPSAVRAPLDPGKIAWGAVFGGQSAVKWFWGKAAGSTASTDAIALGRANLPEILAQLAKGQAYFAPYYEEVAKRVGLVTGKLAVDGDLLVGTLKLEIK